ncbi:forkhead box protein F1 [Sarcoptes scabiei]|nr:forkhead box protein F1 [Sarcoptes scabiei]
MSEAMIVDNSTSDKSMKDEDIKQFSSSDSIPSSGDKIMAGSGPKETPRRRKRMVDVTDSSLVLETPPGVDENRRHTRSQSRGTPMPPTPIPSKRVAREKPPTSNGSANVIKGKRGRPSKSSAAENQNKTESITENENLPSFNEKVIPNESNRNESQPSEDNKDDKFKTNNSSEKSNLVGEEKCNSMTIQCKNTEDSSQHDKKSSIVTENEKISVVSEKKTDSPTATENRTSVAPSPKEKVDSSSPLKDSVADESKSISTAKSTDSITVAEKKTVEKTEVEQTPKGKVAQMLNSTEAPNTIESSQAKATINSCGED